MLPLIEAVQIVEDRTQWWDVKGYSSRLNKPQYLGGLVGSVTLASRSWAQLLPYLLLGESIATRQKCRQRRRLVSGLVD